MATRPKTVTPSFDLLLTTALLVTKHRRRDVFAKARELAPSLVNMIDAAERQMAARPMDLDFVLDEYQGWASGALTVDDMARRVVAGMRAILDADADADDADDADTIN